MRQIYTLKLKSSRVKEFGYNVNIGFDEARELKEVIALADNQMLRTIREVRGQVIDFNEVEDLYSEREELKNKFDKSKNTNERNELREKTKAIQDKINNILFMPDYVTIVIEHKKHYEYMYQNGVMINGKLYKRLSCSAGQARKSTVVFCTTDIIDEVKRRLNNDRDVTVPLSPSKYNAYFGLSGSATQIVSEPKFIVVRDFENEVSFDTHHVTETEYDADDIVETKTVTQMFNRTDGMGLISPRQAQKWADELGLDYVPSQFGIRQAFIKGMLCVFPIHEFCEDVNDGNYIVDTIYKDADGNYIKADLRDYDVILSESQFKLWNCYKNIDEYIESCHKNGLQWGVPLYAPKEAKNILKMNYQFLQTLNLTEKDIEEIAKPFVDWINGVSYDRYEYMLLFLLGLSNTEDSIKNFLRSSDNYWLKSLVLNPQMKNDKYTRSKIKRLIKMRIQKGCMGDIFVDGNFQIIVSDPYGFMQHVCGLDVTGLLGKNEFYSNYWNERNVTRVDGMRSPLTFRSEHVVMNLIKTEQTEKWYRYCKLGIILNYHGHETANFGGSDFDLDILATTSDPYVINGVYSDELTMMYEPPKPQKKIIEEDDLYNSDLFSFGSIIGSITNKSSNAYALLEQIKSEHGTDNEMFRITYERLIQCCKAQSCQIDKAKIGKEVKGIPKLWVNYVDPNAKDKNGIDKYTEEQKKQHRFYNSILLDKYPYFFRYRYKDCKRKYDKYVDVNETTCQQRFKMSLKSLRDLRQKTVEQLEFLKNFDKYLPVTNSDSPMNILCRYIEGINFDISQKIKADDIADVYKMFKTEDEYSEEEYSEISGLLTNYLNRKVFSQIENRDISNDSSGKDDIYLNDFDILRTKAIDVTNSIGKTINCVVDYFYVEYPHKNKDIMWSVFGKDIFNNLKRKIGGEVMFPLPDVNGDIEYLGERFSLRVVEIE